MRVTGSDDQERGFSMIELLTVLAVLVILVALATLHIQPTLQEYQSNAAMDQVKGTLRQARELAISRRRGMFVDIQNDAQGRMAIQLYQASVAPNIPVLPALVTIPIESTVQVATFGAEVDTPDRFGVPPVSINGTGIEFGGAVVGPELGEFQEDGSFTDRNLVLLNGTVFLTPNNIANNMLLSGARAVTIMGTTGRIRSYHYSGAGWRQVE
ncbi:MAG TPA: prepilin-type N-terminal cleavage/methylation domain-containing protein [Candidatus Acidoferrales bacterium]|nr:prepilin-type N-terminal cleavage/methylation domain-containing protein [Candidatus Acidoferrales bacterium]